MTERATGDEPKPVEGTQMVSWRRVGIGVLVLGGAVLALAWINSILPPRGCGPHPVESRIPDARQVVLACRSYAADNEGGRFPASLDDLMPDYLDARELFYDRGGVPLWHYVPGSTDDPADAEVPVVILREPIEYQGKLHCAIGYAGGKVKVWSRRPEE